jgi:hypothetical protein
VGRGVVAAVVVSVVEARVTSQAVRTPEQTGQVSVVFQDGNSRGNHGARL